MLHVNRVARTLFILLVSQLLVVDRGLRLSLKDILKHDWFSKDGVTVTQARQVMGLRPDMTEERDSGKGST